MDTINAIQTLAPDDIKRGDYITITHDTCQLIQGDCDAGRPLEIVRLTYIPMEAGEALRVIEACLPFIIAEDSRGNIEHVDLREQHIARVSKRFGKAERRHRKQLEKKERKKARKAKK